MSIDPVRDLREKSQSRSSGIRHNSAVSRVPGKSPPKTNPYMVGSAIPLPGKLSLLCGGRCGVKCYSGYLAFGIVAPKR